MGTFLLRHKYADSLCDLFSHYKGADSIVKKGFEKLLNFLKYGVFKVSLTLRQAQGTLRQAQGTLN